MNYIKNQISKERFDEIQKENKQSYLDYKDEYGKMPVCKIMINGELKEFPYEQRSPLNIKLVPKKGGVIQIIKILRELQKQDNTITRNQVIYNLREHTIKMQVVSVPMPEFYNINKEKKIVDPFYNNFCVQSIDCYYIDDYIME